MLLKNNFRYAYASSAPIENPPFSNTKINNVSFDSSNSNDFEAFSSGGYTSPPRKKKKAPQRSPQKRTPVTVEISGRTLLIAAAAVVGIILLIVICALLFSSGKDGIIEYKNNTFAAFIDDDGVYRVAMNGKTLSEKFDNEVSLTVAKDNSFAYLTTVVDDAKNVYLLEKGKLSLICEKITEPLAFCDYEPGVIYKYSDRIEYYYDGLLTTLSKKSSALPTNFVISPDGSAIAFTMKNDASIDDLYVYSSEMSAPKARSKGDKNTIPVAISNDGEYLFAYTTEESSNDLYVIVDVEHYKIGNVTGSFNSLISQNSDGTEIVFATKNDTSYITYVYNCKEQKKNTRLAKLVGTGYAVPQFADQTLCAPKTFKKTYFSNITNPATIYLNKKYECTEIYNFTGNIDPDEKYLYVIVPQADNMLVQVELLGEKNAKKNNQKTTIATEVTDFVITQKGNIYYIDGYGDLFFYKLAKGKPTRITMDVTDLTFYSFSNELYFERIDSIEENGVYLTTEGSDYEAVKFGKVALKDSPTIETPYSKNSYSYYYDKTEDKQYLFYTSNGGSFKQVKDFAMIVPINHTSSNEFNLEGLS